MPKCLPFAHCAWCGSPLPIVDGQIQQWRVADGRFACNDFCAEGVEQQLPDPDAR